MSTLWEEKLDVLDAAQVHWSTGTILAVFFAASLISAVFFGLGYSFGLGGKAKSTQAVASPEAINHPSAATSEKAQPTAQNRGFTGNAIPTVPAGNLPPASAASNTRAAFLPVSVSKARLPAPRTNVSPASASAGATRYMVQVGAIGNRKDAQILVSQLRRHGFHAAIYPGKHDKFLHVQIGPFSNAEQAQKMRHKVLANGYRAMLKHAS